MSKNVSLLDPKKFLIVKGANVHNLKNVDVAIPRNKLIVVTGVSGSGKSSLTIDTIYAEGQRRYVESLSSYARQFLNRMNKPDVDYIKGVCPAIAIEQKVVTRTSRSTVGTLTEIYDYLRLLFARVGNTYSPISGDEVKRHSVSDVVDFLLQQKAKSKWLLLAPFIHKSEERSISAELKILLQKGFSRLWSEDQKIIRIEEAIENTSILKAPYSILVDRFVINPETDDFRKRMADSIQIAFFEGEGECIVYDAAKNAPHDFNNKFELDGMSFEDPSPTFFNFNSPYGACKKCEGFGSIIGISEQLVIPNKSLSVFEEAIACWKGEKMKWWKDQLVNSAHHFDFPVHRPIKDLSEEQYNLLWTGNEHFDGLHAFFKHLESKSYKIAFRVMLARYRGRTACDDCRGTRLRKDTKYVKIDGKSIIDLVLMPIDELLAYFQDIKLTDYQQKVATRLLNDINIRLQFMQEVGLPYLSLNRNSSTLSGGETQRINLTRTLGSNLTSSMYILDEPSIGLHAKDTDRLIKVLKALRDLGNTVLVVEHEEAIIKAADHIIDMGPFAGRLGGEIIFEGESSKILKSKKSLTAQYLLGKKEISIPTLRRKAIDFIYLKGCQLHNLKNIDISIPLNVLSVVAGVSGSGKTTLVKQLVYPALKRSIDNTGDVPNAFDELTGDLASIDQIEMIDQNPLGKSSRSNPVTYVKAYDAIRKLFANQNLSKIRGYQAKHFSFNVDGGRCDQCKGEGETVVEMQFLADVHLVCDACDGRRFKKDVLEVKYNGKNISDILDLTIEEAIDFFKEEKEVIKKISSLFEVGLGYIKLGQSSSTLSGGEAQRVKLASFLGKGNSKKKIFFIFDEPSTGLHFYDVDILLKALNALVENGHTVLVIEHDLDIIKSADWLIDLGPDGGKAGGHLLYEGSPEGILSVENSHTASFLKAKMNGIATK